MVKDKKNIYRGRGAETAGRENMKNKGKEAKMHGTDEEETICRSVGLSK